VQRLRCAKPCDPDQQRSVLADDPALTVRWEELDADIRACYPQENLRQPLRIVIDSHNRVTPEHRIVQQAGERCLPALRPMIAAGRKACER
jgi:diaminohydroxyphosphoribosylaminopyrimidine deaminase/5-amino-6-(5-phosphoribosylamino)uracil reductase